MEWWYYKGAVTTPIDIPGKGPTVLKPRTRFEAPKAAVVHLVSIGLVVSIKAPREVVPPAPKSRPVIKPVESKVEFKIEDDIKGDASFDSGVVESSQAKPVAEVSDAGEPTAELDEEEKPHKEKAKRSWRSKG